MALALQSGGPKIANNLAQVAATLAEVQARSEALSADMTCTAVGRQKHPKKGAWARLEVVLAKGQASGRAVGRGVLQQAAGKAAAALRLRALHDRARQLLLTHLLKHRRALGGLGHPARHTLVSTPGTTARSLLSAANNVPLFIICYVSAQGGLHA